MYALTAKGMQYIDTYSINSGIPSAVLMENAARAVVDEAVKRFPDKKNSFLVVCGQGNNGGDGICVARWLLHLGYKVDIYFAGALSNASEGFAEQVRILTKAYPGINVAGLGKEYDAAVLEAKYDCIIDGIFGIGLNKRLGSNYVKFIEYLNSKSGYKIAIDIPSGLNATSGTVMNAVFYADLTVTFGNYKTGMFFGEGKDACGKVVLADIGLMERAYRDVDDKLIICDEEFLEKGRKDILLPRVEQSHKGTYGSVGIIVSSNGMFGASMLAAKAAYRAGCGLVKIFCPSKYTGFFNVSIPEAVVVPYKSDDVLGALSDFSKKLDVILIGPGLKEDSTGRLLVKQVLAGSIPAVFDAGALNLISKNLKSFKRRKCQCVITPHVGEMAKLCGEDKKIIEKNRIGFLKKFSERFKVSMVIKSDTSVISLIDRVKGQNLYMSAIGNSGLATAGSGDVQAGVIASLIAQGNSLNDSLLYGTLVHGMAAEKFGEDEDSKRKMMAGDIIDNLF